MSLEQAIRSNDTTSVLALAPLHNLLTYVGKREIMKRDLFCAFNYSPEINWVADKIRGQMILNNFSKLDVVIRGYETRALSVSDIEYNLSFYQACLYGSIEMIEFFKKTYGMDLYQDLIFSIKAHEKYTLKIPSYICVIILSGDLAKFRHFETEEDTIKGTELSYRFFEFALLSGNVDMIRYIVDTYDITADKCLYSGSSEVDAYLTEKGFQLQNIPKQE